VRSEFDHIGIPCQDKHSHETFVPQTRVWVTNPRAHEANIEWLRFEPDSPVTGPVRDQPHVAYRVANLESAMQGREVLLAPFEVGGGFARVAFVAIDGGVVELMQIHSSDDDSWF
jgi:hypothetical protein